MYGLRPSHDFDSLDIAGEQIAEVEAAAGSGRIVQLYPIDEGNGLLAFRAPDVDRRGCANAAVAGERSARHGTEQINDCRADERRVGQGCDSTGNLRRSP